MIEVQQALDLVKKHTSTGRSISRPVSTSLRGFVLAEDIFSDVNLPEFRQSSMDGYALCGVHDSYEMVGEVAAGSAANFELANGQCVRIFTGAKVPDSADTVVMQEHVTATHSSITVVKSPKVGANIRKMGSQLAAGQRVLKCGTKVTPAVLGLLISIGREAVLVRQPPKVAIVVTGNELVALGQAKGEAQVYESNGSALQAAVEMDGLELISVDHVPDSYEASVETLKIALTAADFVLISGGISVGDYDFMGRALEELGVKKHFHGVRQKPGKPLYFGIFEVTDSTSITPTPFPTQQSPPPAPVQRKENMEQAKSGQSKMGQPTNQKVIFALPGNPASTLTAYYVYVRHALKAYFGIPERTLQLPLGEPVNNPFGRALFVKCTLKNGKATPIDEFNSATLLSFASTELLAYIPADESVINKDEQVQVYLL